MKEKHFPTSGCDANSQPREAAARPPRTGNDQSALKAKRIILGIGNEPQAEEKND